MNKLRMKKKTMLILFGALIVLLAGLMIWQLWPSSETLNDAARQPSSGTQDTLIDVENIPGYVPGTSDGDQTNGLVLPYTIEGSGLCIRSIGSYTGPFVEDGSDRPSVNTLSLIVTNQSDAMIEYAELVFDTDDQEDVVFKITSLPAGASVLVQECNQRTFDEHESLKLKDKMLAVNDDASMMQDKVSITAEGDVLHLINQTEENLETVFVRYKNLLQDDLYMGGITYSCRFDQVEAKADVEQRTEHFIEGNSVILDVVSVPET